MLKTAQSTEVYPNWVTVHLMKSDRVLALLFRDGM